MTHPMSVDHQAQPTPLMALLTELLAKERQITFYRYMDLALHHPQYGYYAKPEPVVGPDGDFMTSPALHPVFGRMLWRQIFQMIQMIGSVGSNHYHILEVGAGTGEMARDIITASGDDGYEGKITYFIREQSQRLRRRQEETILAARPGAPVRWVDDLSAIDGIHVIVMNELMSALPIHRLRYMGDEGWRELYVVLEDGQLAARLGPVSNIQAVQVAEASGVKFRPGQIVDVNVDAARMLKDLTYCLADKSFILNIDYGGPAHLVYDPIRMNGNVRCYYRQQPVTDLFSRPGLQDITADVDFDLLKRTANDLGLQSTDPIPQGRFLLNLGIQQEAQRLAAQVAKGDGQADAELQKVYALYAPEALGNSFWVMAHAKGFNQMPTLTGFQPLSQPPLSLAELVLGARPLPRQNP